MLCNRARLFLSHARLHLLRTRPLIRNLMVPSKTELSNVGPLVAEKYKAALDAGDALFFESKMHITGMPEAEGQPALACVPWQIRTVPALLKKPTGNSSTPNTNEAKPEGPKQNKQDVFAPPYVPNLLVREYEDFTFLVCTATLIQLNKFCVLPKHFLLVTKGRDQGTNSRFCEARAPAVA